MMNEGWICPKCGMVHNPNVAFCPCLQKGHYFHINVSISENEDVKKITDVFKDFKNNKTVYKVILC